MRVDTVMTDAKETAAPAPPSLHGYNAKEVSIILSVETGAESKVQQQFATEVDVNTIMRRYGISQSAPLGPATGVYGDFTDISDYDSAVARIEGARDRFAALPAEVRERFDNDPGVLIRRAGEMEAEAFQALFVGNPIVVDKVSEDP